ncbi:MAG: hypothetical protein OEY99_04930 [Aigarchaeota archaeon]|nr:hypothetical protein [Aigarchaeota archaeon]
MNHRQRVMRALNHRQPDRVPLDEAFRPEVWAKLKQQFRGDEELVRDKLGVDLRTVSIDPPERFTKKSWPSPSFSGFRTVRRLSPNLYEDEWGIRYALGATGRYWHFHTHPLEHRPLDDYDWPDVDAPGRFDNAAEGVDRWKEEYAVAAGGDIEETFFEQSWYLRGFARLLRDFYTNPDFVHDLLDRLQEYRVAQARKLLDLGVDIVRLGDDLGTQNTLILPPRLWREFIKPRLRALIQAIKARGHAKIFYHSDGNIRQLIPELLEIGVEILNPIQPECISPEEVKAAFGDRLTLHGTISIQRTLPFGTPSEVRQVVLARIRDCGSNGGLILAPTHAVQTDTPLENLLTMYRAATEHQQEGQQ